MPIKKMKNWFADNAISFISYGAGIFLLLTVFMILRISPFGNINILKIDLFHSYAPELVQFRETVFEGKSMFHTWTGALGSNAFALLGFHVLSPFAAIILLFPKINVTEAVAVMLLFKIPFSAFTMSFMLKNKFGKKDYSVVIFSLLFAFCAFITAYYWSFPWIDVYFMLPLVMLGVDRLVRENKKLLYCLSLAYSIFSYFYMAAFLCMFAVIYFIAVCVMEKTYAYKKILINRILNFSLFSIIAGVITSIVNIPIIMTLLGTPYMSGEQYAKFGIFNIWNFLTSHYFYLDAALVESTEAAGPSIFIGIITVILVPLYYLNSKITKKEKIVYTAMLFLLFISMEVNVINFVVHIFHKPAGLPYRNSFIYSFLLLVMSYKAFINYEKKKLSVYIIIWLSNIALISVLYAVNGHKANIEQIPSSFTFYTFFFNILAVSIASVLLYKLMTSAKPKQLYCISLSAFVVLELALSISKNVGQKTNLDVNEFMREAYSDMQQVTAKFDAETAFYRSSFHRNHSICDAKIYNMRDMTQFIAPTSAQIIEFTKVLGCSSSMNNVSFLEPTPFLSSIFAFKYILTREYQLKEPIYPVSDQFGIINVYENPNVLPIGFLVNDTVKDFDIKCSSSPFAVQSEFAKKMTGENFEMYREYEAVGCDAKYATVEKTETNNFAYTITNPKITTLVPIIKMQFNIEESGRIYLNFRPSGCENIKVFANGKLKKELTTKAFTATSLDVGYVEAGISLDVEFTHNYIDKKIKEEFASNGNISLFVAQLKMDNYLSYVDILKKTPYEVSFYDDENVKGKITADRDGVMYTSIAYDKAWKVTVDGKDTEPVIIGTALIGVPLAKGEHTVEFSYHQRGMILGFAVSGATLLLLIIVVVIQKIMRNSKKSFEKSMIN